MLTSPYYTLDLLYTHTLLLDYPPAADAQHTTASHAMFRQAGTQNP